MKYNSLCYVLGLSVVLSILVWLFTFITHIAIYFEGSWEKPCNDAMQSANGTSLLIFFIVFFLSCRDSIKFLSVIEKNHNKLMTGSDVDQDSFLVVEEPEDAELLLETREAVAAFFDIPVEKISRDIDLIDDIKIDQLNPAFYLIVGLSVCVRLKTIPRFLGFYFMHAETIDELAEVIGIVTKRDGFS